jgi:hypothetical protein
MTPGAVAHSHVRDVRAAARALPDDRAEPGALDVDVARALNFRARATHLDGRLPAGAYRLAAFGGLQDSAPRAALTALHARLPGVSPASWEDPALVQIWFRFADCLIPKVDFGVFTLGALPRDGERAAALDAIAHAVCHVLAARPLRTGDLVGALPATLGRMGHDPAGVSGIIVYAASVTGRFRIRWDTRTTTVIAAEPAEGNAEEMRLELARRFLGWHGPATVAQFAKWAGLCRSDADETWRRLTPELIPVSVDGRARHLLARDEQALLGAEPPSGIRFLPMGDPYLAIDRRLLDAQAATVLPPTRDQHGLAVTRRLVNSLGGRILVDGRIAGAWGRAQERMAIYMWSGGELEIDRLVIEAETFDGPIGKPMRLRHLR